MRLALLFNKTRPDTTGVYFERALGTLGVQADHWALRDVERVPEGYDAYLRIDYGDDYELAWPARLRPSIFYAIDTHLSRSWAKIRRMAGDYDAVFCCHRKASVSLPGARWLPVACDPQLHVAPPTARTLDMAFVGTDGGVPRKFYLQALRERYPNSAIGPADFRQMAALYGRAKIGFNYSIADDVNMRMFEVLAGGALLVTNALTGDDLARLDLSDRRDLVLYRRPEDLFPLIDYYLAHPQERETIARQGQQLALARHTYRHRMQELLAVLEYRPKLARVHPLGEPLTCGS